MSGGHSRQYPISSLFMFCHIVSTSATLTAAIGNCSRADSVVPFRMERVTLNVERLHLGIADLDALFVSARIDLKRSSTREFRAVQKSSRPCENSAALRGTLRAAQISRPTTAQSRKNRENWFSAQPYGASRRVFARSARYLHHESASMKSIGYAVQKSGA